MISDINMPSANGPAEAACRRGWEAFKNRDDEAAAEQFKASLNIHPSAEAHYGAGLVCERQGKADAAATHLREALKLNPYMAEAYGALGDLFVKKRQGLPALENYAQAVAADPSANRWKVKLIDIVQGLSVRRMNDNLKSVLLECLETPGIDLTNMGRAWLSIVTSDPHFAALYKLSRHQDYAAFKAAFDKLPNYTALFDPFFLTGLGLFIVPEPAFERWAMHLRRRLLDSITADQSLFPEEEMEYIVCALSRYCFLTDYIFPITAEEEKQIATLRAKIEQTNTPSLSDLALYGCYDFLHRLNNARAIAPSLPGGDHVSQIPKSQIEDRIAQQDVRNAIPAITKIKDQISAAVQAQYEEFPYPRWTALNKDIRDEEIEGPLTGTGASILIAGCGTGKEALELAHVFPDARILAVDLSLSSLSYAVSKAREMAVENIEFRHGDIMELGALDTRFDYIASSGVLHHMKDPAAGWRVITGLLKPKGLMRIALYSRPARAAIIEARHVIAEKGIGADTESIRNFRQNAATHLKYAALKNIENFLDYYSLPECRDLLFHVQEHQFDLREIAKILDDLGLDFLKFYLPAEILEKYARRFPNDPQGVNLENWSAWEEKKPDTFVGMYRFWCRKKN